MKRILRSVVMIAAASTLVWLHGCGKPEGGSLAEQRRLQSERAAVVATEQADAKATAEAQVQEAEAQRLKNEAPSVVGADDFKRGKKLEGGGYLSTTIRGGLVAVDKVNFANLYHNLEIHAAATGSYPKSHEAFMKLINEWGLPLPELDGPYEYVYNPEDHQLYKQPITE